MKDIKLIDVLGDELISMVQEWYKKIRKDHTIEEAGIIVNLAIQNANSKLDSETFLDIDRQIGKLKRCKNCNCWFDVKGNRKVFCSKECSKYYHDHKSHFRGPDGRNRK